MREEDNMREGLWGLSLKATDLVMIIISTVVLVIALAWLTWIAGGAF